MRLISILAVMLALSGAALAKSLPDGGLAPDDVAAVLRGKGYVVEIGKDNDGDPVLRTAAGEIKFGVYFYNRNNQSRYDSIQFAASFTQKVEPAKLADWNRRKRFGRVYLDDRAEPWIEMDIETTRGITTEALEENLLRWVAVLQEFQKYVAGQ